MFPLLQSGDQRATKWRTLHFVTRLLGSKRRWKRLLAFCFYFSFSFSVTSTNLAEPTLLQQIFQRWPESLFQSPTLLLFQNFRIRVRQFFKFENPTPVQTLATIIDQTEIYPCFYLRNEHTDSCYCRNGEVTPDPGPFFHKFLTPGPDPKEKRRISPEST